jgi:hypothetical protein
VFLLSTQQQAAEQQPVPSSAIVPGSGTGLGLTATVAKLTFPSLVWKVTVLVNT